MYAEIVEQNSIDRKQWDEFVYHSPQGGFFMLTGIMDILAPGWKGIIVYNKMDKIMGLMPLLIKKKLMINYALQPVFAQYWGICFSSFSTSKTSKIYARKNKICKTIIDKIPQNLHLFSYNFSPRFDYPFNFFWNGFQLQTRYSYQVKLDEDPKKIRKNFSEDLNNKINKSINSGFQIVNDKNTERLFQLLESDKSNQYSYLNEKESITQKKLFQYLSQEKMGKTLIMENRDGHSLAGGFFVKFNNTITFLTSVMEPNFRKQGSVALLMWEAIKDASGESQIFDFEGSMIQGIEFFFRKFGGRPVPYLNISKNKLPLGSLWKKLP